MNVGEEMKKPWTSWGGTQNPIKNGGLGKNDAMVVQVGLSTFGE